MVIEIPCVDSRMMEVALNEILLKDLEAAIETLRDFAYGNVELRADLPRFDKRRTKRHRQQIVNWPAWHALRRGENRVRAAIRDMNEASAKILEKERPVTSGEPGGIGNR